MGNSTVSKSRGPDVYQIVTDKILELLDKGTIPWHKPWKGGFEGIPKNAISKKPYRGVNVFLLAITAEVMGYDSPYWFTYKQAQQYGGNVKAGEKSTFVVFWKWLDYVQTDKETGEKTTDKVPFLRYYRVFNLAQCEGVDLSKLPVDAIDDTPDLDFSPIGACENVFGNMADCPPIYHDQGRACYIPSKDEIHLPKRENFTSVEDYYATAFHELAHSTGHDSRLGRHDKDRDLNFGSNTYSKEELIAEMGAAFLCGVCEIDNQIIDNSAAYIDGWRKKIKGDKKLVVNAAAQAQKAVDYILNGKGGDE